MHSVDFLKFSYVKFAVKVLSTKFGRLEGALQTEGKWPLMYLLSPIYSYIVAHYANSFNHFPLVRLIFYSLDKSLIYFLLFLLLRGIYFLVKKKRPHWPSELVLWVFIFYLLLLLALTVFRGIYFPWQIKIYWQRPRSQINLVPLVETLKLRNGTSSIDFIYNLYGNIAWFVPFGLLWPLVRKRRGFFQTVFAGMLLSFLIETVQFFIWTGISDIDDIIFNTSGAIVGYLLFWLFLKRFMSRKA